MDGVDHASDPKGAALLCPVPSFEEALDARTAVVEVSVNGGLDYTDAGAAIFELYDEATLIRVASPLLGPTAGGTIVTLTGDFPPSARALRCRFTDSRERV